LHISKKSSNFALAKDKKEMAMKKDSFTERLSKAGEWMRNHTTPLIIINDREAIEALRA